MTSQPGTTGRTGTPGDTGHPPRGRTPAAGPRVASGQPWPLVLPLALLIILGLAGLRGVVTAPHWNGPLRHDRVAIGLVLEVILAVLLAATARRRTKAMRAAMLGGVPVSDVPAKLRSVLIFVLGAGMIGVAVAIVNSLHPHVRAPKLPLPTSSRGPVHHVKPRSAPPPPASFHVPLAAILYGLLIVALVAAVVLSVWWARRFRVSFGGRHGDFIAEDPEDLREAVESGRAALRTVDDARAAIIACYVAMENSLAERGTARAVADTPDELLARAARSGLVHGTAAARLTALFYEARFSSHPMDRGQRDAAERALDELSAALAEADAARPEPTGTGAGP
jgi:uncharacterized membrane protein YedE/YeeE